MRREWNVPLFATELADDEEAAQALAAVAEPRFLESMQAALALAQGNGEKICIATIRGKYDAEGNRVDGEDDAVGQFRTDGYQFDIAGEESWQIERNADLEGVSVSHMLALEIAVHLTPALIRSILDLKVIFDRFGGQAWIAPYVIEGQIVGYVFVWEHISKLGRGKEPDARISEPLPLKVASADE